MFLVDKLPKESVETTEETLGIYHFNCLLIGSEIYTLDFEREFDSSQLPLYLKQDCKNNFSEP